MKNEILVRFNQTIEYRHCLVGEMFEGTHGFTTTYQTECMLLGKTYKVTWDDYSWSIE